MPYHQITQLADALSQPGTQASVLTELLTASQCDLLITRMLDGTEDYAEPPPIDEDTPEGATARNLLRWALADTVPDHHQGHARRGPLINDRDSHKLADLGQQLVVGEYGPDLVSFGIAFIRVSEVE